MEGHAGGSDAFQEADTVGITRPCTKHNWLVKETDKLSELATTYAKTFTPTVENQFFPRNTEIFVEPNWKLWLQTVGIKPATPKIEKQNAINIIKAMHEVEHKQSAPGITNRQWSNR